MPVNDIQFLGHVFRAYGTGGVVPRCAKIRRLLAEQAERLAPNAFSRGGYAISPISRRLEIDMIACCDCGDQPICNAADYRLGGRSVRVVLAKCERCRVIRWDICEFPGEGYEGVRTVTVGSAIDWTLRLAAERWAATQRGCRQLSADYCAAREAARASAWLGYPWRPWEPAPREIPNDLARRPEPRNLGY